MHMDDAPSSPSAEPREIEIAPFEHIQFTPEQERHVDLMRSVARAITTHTGENYVLKGGTALLLAYDLPRYSEDLDFDGKRSTVDLTRSIAIGSLQQGLRVERLTTKKNTDTTKRHMLHYGAGSGDLLKIEASFRQSEAINEDDVTSIDGIRVYKIEKLAPLKIEAFLNRLAARDIFDVAFLLKRYPDSVSDDYLRKIDELVTAIGLNELETTMLSDRILEPHDCEHVALSLDESLDDLKTKRGL